jgi:2-hydroxy-3-keto-5-methylthiopentenyl-1-phosphate phosphatase
MTINELKKVFTQKKEKFDKKTFKIAAGFKSTNFEQFNQWFKKEEFELGCHYCGTTNSQSIKLYNMQRSGLRFDGTRGGKRGKRLELDRKDPSKSYDELDNMVWCCYWCNNAKSNFFSYEEFKPIAIAIGQVLKSL